MQNPIRLEEEAVEERRPLDHVRAAKVELAVLHQRAWEVVEELLKLKVMAEVAAHHLKVREVVAVGPQTDLEH